MLSLLPWSIRSTDECEILDQSGFSNFLSSLASSLRTLPTIFGFIVSTDFPDILLDNPNYLPYIYGLVGFAIIFILLFILIFIYFFFGMIFCCCKFLRPKHSRAVTSSVLLSFLISCLFYIGSVVLFFFAASNIVGSYDRVVEGIGNISPVVSFVFSAIDTAVNETFSTIDYSIQSADESITSLIEFLSIVTSDFVSQIKIVQDDIDRTGESMKVLVNLTAEFDKIMNSSNWNKDSEPFCRGNELSSLEETARTGYELLEEFMRILTQVNDSLSPLSDFAVNASKSKDNLIDMVESQINYYRYTAFPDLLDPFREEIDTVVGMINNVEGTVSPYEKYLDPAVWLSVALLCLVIIAQLFCFFLRNRYASCVLGSFWHCGFCENIFVGLLGLIFAVLFVFLSDVCPDLGDMIHKVGYKYLTFLPGIQLDDILTCPADMSDKSLYYLGNLSSVFDYKHVIEELKEAISNGIDSLNISEELRQQINDASSLDPTANFTIEAIFDVDISNLTDKVNLLGYYCGNDESVIEEAILILNNISATIDTIKENLGIALDDAENITNFTENVLTTVDNTLNSVNLIANDLGDQVYTIIDDSVMNLTCELICPIYVPVQNALCYNIVNGFAYWSVSSIILSFTLLSLSCQICNRRKDMLPVVVEDEDVFSSGGALLSNERVVVRHTKSRKRGSKSRNRR